MLIVMITASEYYYCFLFGKYGEQIYCIEMLYILVQHGGIVVSNLASQ